MRYAGNHLQEEVEGVDEALVALWGEEFTLHISGITYSTNDRLLNAAFFHDCGSISFCFKANRVRYLSCNFWFDFMFFCWRFYV